MEAIILIGIQGSGKTTFYQQWFSGTHVRLSLDMLKSRHRQRMLINACITAKQQFVLDNTSVRRAERAEYILTARTGRFLVKGYFFEPQVERALAWNEQRPGKARVPVKGVLGTLKQLERPVPQEGFDQLYRVCTDPAGQFIVEDWEPPY